MGIGADTEPSAGQPDRPSPTAARDGTPPPPAGADADRGAGALPPVAEDVGPAGGGAAAASEDVGAAAEDTRQAGGPPDTAAAGRSAGAGSDDRAADGGAADGDGGGPDRDGADADRTGADADRAGADADRVGVNSDSALQRAAARIVRVLRPLERYWIGRVALQSLEEVTRLEIFDRAMVLAAQVFTSIFPILILFAVLISQTDLVDVSDSMSLPPTTAQVLQNVLGNSTPSSFGVVGVLLVFISGTSLSRALARMYQTVWRIPKPRTRPSHWWRWLAVILAFAVSLVAVRGLVRWSNSLTPAPLWNVALVTAGYTALWWLVSYLLLLGRFPPRVLLPGAVLAGFSVAVVGRVGSLVLPASLASSEQRYGPIGVAFTYLGFLYVTAFALIAATVVGAVLVRDDGGFGRWLRAGWTAP